MTRHDSGTPEPDAPGGTRDRIKAIAAETDIDVRIRKMAAMLDELERQFEQNSEELGVLQRSFGLTPGQSRSLLDGDQLSEESRTELHRSIDEFTRQMMDEVKREAQQALGGSAKAARAVRPGRMRV